MYGDNEGKPFEVGVQEYRGVWWNSQVSLSKALGVTANSIRHFLSNNDSCTLYDYIDYRLKSYTYEEYVANGYKGMYRYRKIEWENDTELASKLGICLSTVANFLKTDKYRNRYQLIDQWLIKASVDTGNADNIKLMKHNQELYKQVLDKMMEGYRSVFYSEATGLGKSFIMMQLINMVFRGMKVLYIVPKQAIWIELKNYEEFQFIKKSVDAHTYAYFNKGDVVEKVVDKYDVVFVDECHHIKSPVQGLNVSKVCDGIVAKGGYAFGMTATPYVEGAYIDNKYFSVSCYGYDIFAAIAEGILPKIDYAITVADEETIPEDVRSKITGVSAELALTKVADKHSGIEHWLGFFSRVSDLLDSIAVIQRILPEHRIFCIYKGRGKDTAKTLQAFNLYEGKSILLSVDMLLEGVHLRKCGGVLLFRNVQSDIVLWQVIGRLCNLNWKESPVFVDVTQSFDSAKSLIRKRQMQIHEREYTVRDIFKVQCSFCEYLDLFKVTYAYRVKKYRGVEWKTVSGLARALGTSIARIRYQMQVNPQDYERKVVDNILKDFTYEEFIENGFVGKWKSCGYEWNDIKELASILNVYPGTIRYWLQRHETSDEREYVKHRLNKKEKVEYRNVIWENNNYESLGRAMHVRAVSIKRWLRSHKESDVRKYIDYRLGSLSYSEYLREVGAVRKQTPESRCYRGITFTTPYSVCKALGVSPSYYYAFHKQNPEKGEEAFIDKILDRRNIYNEY